MIVRVAPQAHWPWISERANLAIGPGFGAMEAIEGPEDDPRIIGMIGFDGWTPASVSMHVAIESPIALRRLLPQCFGMAFDQAKKRIVTALVLSNNTRSLALVRHVGFREVFRGRGWHSSGVDIVLFEMRRRECRFVPRKMRAPRVDNAAGSEAP